MRGFKPQKTPKDSLVGRQVRLQRNARAGFSKMMKHVRNNASRDLIRASYEFHARAIHEAISRDGRDIHLKTLEWFDKPGNQPARVREYLEMN